VNHAIDHPPSPAPPAPAAPPQATTDREAARRARVDAIRDAAIVRSELGLLWQHKLDPIEQHVVWWYDRQAGELREYCGATVKEAIERARRDGR